MYDFSSITICSVLLLAMLAALELGYRGGAAYAARSSEGQRSQLNAAQGSLLGLLALLLGFTFSLALQRYDDRSRAVIDEANAIGTTMLRAELLDGAVRDDVLATLDEYLRLRVDMSGVAMNEHEQRDSLLARASGLQATLWAQARQAAALDDRPVTSGMYIQALNELIDSYGRRDAALARHVPPAVLMLLFLTFVGVCAIVGVTSGASGTRPPKSMLVMAALIVLLVFIIIDLDRPRRGLIEIDQSSLTALLPGD